MVSDAVWTLYGPLVSERYVTDVTIYTAHHRFMVGISDPFLRSMNPLAIIRTVLKCYRLNLEIHMRLVFRALLV